MKRSVSDFWEELRSRDNLHLQSEGQEGSWIPAYSLELKGLWVHLYCVRGCYMARFSTVGNGACTGEEILRNGICFEDFVIVTGACVFLSLTKPFLQDMIEVQPLADVEALRAAIDMAVEDDTSGILNTMQVNRRVRASAKRRLNAALKISQRRHGSKE